ncbi:arylsulfatase [Pedobacter sandarakinus]|uniref:arylsulfatase n=1 Tax=Pedobacter sandarakinus TaxID=353156 RepID=UPI002247D657|nr:arylsulfatase [Pedobacter sandarakinus]MCX2575453.1 arylsulfatase [Pedobacter sandarakinus]
MRISQLKQATFFLVPLFITTTVFAQKNPSKVKKPNIIIILADDLGYSDLGCYGGEISTPNLDWLAKGGIKMTSFYNASRCCPTRASLLTGLYPHQAGIGNMTTNQNQPGYTGSLSANAVTIAQVLKQDGYQTGMVGKWHVSETNAFPDKQQQLLWLDHKIQDKDFADTLSYPTHKGFDKFYGNIWGVVDYFDPFSLVNGSKPVKEVPKNFYYTNVIGDSTANYINGFSNKANPFFLYVAFTAPHWPLQALESDIKKYENTYKKGWQYTREQRYKRMIKMGLLDPKTEGLSQFMYPEKDWASNPDKNWDSRAMAVHAAMVDCLDQNVGKLIKQLRANGELDNTLIMFLSDNGASPERPEVFGPGYDRSGTTRSGENIVFPVDKKVLPGPQTTHAGIGQEWANVSCTPFRYWKSKEHEGGIATPFIAYWPEEIKAGQISNAPAHVIDLMATCLQVSGAKYPSTFEGNTIIKNPGKSLFPVFEGTATKASDRTLFWEHNGAAALRVGDWKIVRTTAKEQWELYDLHTDRSEIHNLSAEYPEKVRQMTAAWTNLAEEYKVFPKPQAVKNNHDN